MAFALALVIVIYYYTLKNGQAAQKKIEYLEKENKNRNEYISTLCAVLDKYEKELGKKDSLRILDEIQNNMREGNIDDQESI